MEEEQDKAKKAIPSVQTFTEDMVKVIEDDKEGLIKKIIKEQEEHERLGQNTSPKSTKNRIFFAVGIVLLLAALGLLGFLVVRESGKVVESPSVKIDAPSLLFTDKIQVREVGGLDKDRVVGSFLGSVDQVDVKNRGIEAIYLTEDKSIIGLNKFLKLIKANFAPEESEVVSDNFLLGVTNTDGAKGIFILLKTSSFVDIFPVLRSWEDKMFSDLYPIFGLNLPSSASYLLSKSFEDGIVNNKNARILYDDNGNIAIMYVFANDQSVIISNSQDSVREVMLRLSGSKAEK